MAEQSLRAYTPDPSHVRVLPWVIELSADATVLELALLMNRFRCKAEIIDADVLRLTPITPDQRCPTGEEVARLFEQGMPGMRLSLKQVER